MKILKYMISAIISVAVSIACFESKIWAIIVVFCLINMIIISSKNKVSNWKKQRKYYVCLAICIVGGILIVLGKEIIKSDFIIIVGAMMFATTFAGIVIKDFTEYYKIYIKEEENHTKHE